MSCSRRQRKERRDDPVAPPGERQWQSRGGGSGCGSGNGGRQWCGSHMAQWWVAGGGGRWRWRRQQPRASRGMSGTHTRARAHTPYKSASTVERESEKARMAPLAVQRPPRRLHRHQRRHQRRQTQLRRCGSTLGSAPRRWPPSRPALQAAHAARSACAARGALARAASRAEGRVASVAAREGRCGSAPS